MTQQKKVDRNLFEPSYVQLARILQEQIAAGDFRPSERLPSESQLCKYHQVSPMTVRRAINTLVKDGVVVAEQGRGTFVKPMRFWEATFHLNKLQQLFAGKEETNVKIFEASIVSADYRIADKMAIKTGQRVIFIRRLISLKEKPFLYHREYLLYDPKSPIIESELGVTSLEGLFHGSGNTYLKGGKLSIEAAILNEEEALMLQSLLASPAFRLEHTFYDFDNRLVSWGWFMCPGDRMRFTTTSGVSNEESHNNESRG
jgi:GntR family transcriptional regulator